MRSAPWRRQLPPPSGSSRGYVDWLPPDWPRCRPAGTDLALLLAILGPTAAGKSRMAVEVAKRLDSGVEIVSCDSMAVYKGLDIVADIPTGAERDGIPHHMVNLIAPSETFTAVRYRDHARAAIDDIAGRGGVPMLVGGSGLYFRAVVDDLEFAPTDSEVRARLEARPPSELLELLREVDPDRAAELDARNVRRLVRAVEIWELTARKPSEFRDAWVRHGNRYDLHAIGLTWPREELMARATERIDVELGAGLIDEVRSALQDGVSQTARQALGVKEIIGHVQGRVSLEEAKSELERNTRRFVRRQLQWFNADDRLTWIDVGELGWDPSREQIVRRFRGAIGLD